MFWQPAIWEFALPCNARIEGASYRLRRRWRRLPNAGILTEAWLAGTCGEVWNLSPRIPPPRHGVTEKNEAQRPPTARKSRTRTGTSLFSGSAVKLSHHARV